MHATRFSSHSTGARRYPLSYVYSGYYRWDAVESGAGHVSGQDNHAMWWSATAKNESHANHLNIYIYNPYFNPEHDDYKVLGFALRCVLLLHICPSVSAFVCMVWSL